MFAFVTFTSVFSVCTSSSTSQSLSRAPSTWLGAKSSPGSRSLTFFPSRLLTLQPLTRHEIPTSEPKFWKRCTPCALGGGGFLGVGPAEVVVIVAVGWFLLGPTKLYALAKDSGKVIGELRKTADEARETFQEALEFDLEKDPEKESTVIADALTKQMSKAAEATGKRNDREPTSTENATSANTNDVPSIPAMVSVVDELKPIPSKLEDVTIPVDSVTSTADDSIFPQAEQISDNELLSPQFRDQIKRVNDPKQVPPSDVPDLDTTLDFEQQEVKRLEREYLEARARLEEREKASPTSPQSQYDENSVASKQASEQTDSSSTTA